MRILAVDTCSRSCSVAVTDSGKLAGEVTTLRPQTHSRHLMRMIDMALEMAGTTLDAVDAFGVTRGPGSFTGLRIGISTIKGLALAAGKPAVGVSSLQALALPLMCFDRLVCALLDAGKGEVYSASYRFARSAGLSETEGDSRWGTTGFSAEEKVLHPADVLADITAPCTFVGEGARAYASLITARLGEKARLAANEHHVIRGASVARLAFLRLKYDAGNDITGLVPRYLRKSDAELNLDAKRRTESRNA